MEDEARGQRCVALLAGPEPPPRFLGPCRTLWIPLLKIHVVRGSSTYLLKMAPLFEAIAFTSPRSPKALREDAERNRILRGIREALEARDVWAVGPRTASTLREELGVDALTPSRYTTESLALELVQHGYTSILAVRRPRASPTLPDTLVGNGIVYAEIHVYRAEIDGAWKEKVSAVLRGGVDYLVATSSEIARYMAMLDGRIISIGPQTSKTLMGLGVEPACEARESTLQGIAECLESLEHNPP
ncbi:MAG: uroporphyrinogen-III synthase [Desulfurococcales archaeon]|nr:uroporphyrinogen-III synthase [Desulfurococcales archaeon]